MSAVEETVAHLEELLAQQAAQIAALSQRQAEVDPVLLAQQRHGVEAQLDAPPKSMPEGAIPMDSRPLRVRRREQAIAKMAQLAKNRGGVWSTDARIPKIYGHRGFDPRMPQREPCPLYGTEEYVATCQRTCWTPQTETRFLHALGLRDMAASELIPLTPPDPKNNPDLLRELVGLLKPQPSTLSDTLGRYETGSEHAEVSQSADTRRKTVRV